MNRTADRTRATGTMPVPLEDAEQETVFRWAKLQENRYPELKWIHAIPNGGYRFYQTAVKLKRTGTKSGVPDICFPVAKHGYHGMYIEMKRIKGGQVSQNQKEWIKGLQDNGYNVIIAHGANEAIEALKQYLD